MATQSPPLLPGVRDVIAVHSAKGGVGKSTTTANLAVAFARLGLQVGVLDADIYGPSVALLFGHTGQPFASPNGRQVLPLERHGVKFLSMTNVMTDDAPVIWRGPMVMSALQELLGLVDWGDLDVLLIDMPPGTGDVVLTLAQAVPLSGVVTVTTPQEVALADTRRGIDGFRSLQVPVLGVVENMAGFVCDACGDVADLFGRGGGETAARDLGLPFLGRVPLEPAVRAGADAGVPAAADPERAGAAGAAYGSIAHAVIAQLTAHGRGAGAFEIKWERMPIGETRPEPPPASGDVASADGETPLALWQVADDRLGIRWGDGAVTRHGAYELRRACPCAGCVDEWTREELPALGKVPRDVRPVTIRSVGRYAIQPVWSDGHRSGIYSFRELRRGVAVVPA